MEEIKKIFTSSSIFLVKILVIVGLIIVSAILLGKFLPASVMGKLWKEEKTKKNIKELEKTEKKIKRTRVRLKGLNDEIKDFLRNNKKYK